MLSSRLFFSCLSPALLKQVGARRPGCTKFIFAYAGRHFAINLKNAYLSPPSVRMVRSCVVVNTCSLRSERQRSIFLKIMKDSPKMRPFEKAQQCSSAAVTVVNSSAAVTIGNSCFPPFQKDKDKGKDPLFYVKIGAFIDCCADL